MKTLKSWISGLRLCGCVIQWQSTLIMSASFLQQFLEGLHKHCLQTSRLLMKRIWIQHAESWIGLTLLCCCISYLESGPKESVGVLRKFFGYHNTCLVINKNICVGKNIKEDQDHFSFSCVKFSSLFFFFLFSSSFPTVLLHRTPMAKCCSYSLKKIF